jgi:g-D-glutamyl-meso-diaminopimelate peptidase
MHDSHNDIFPDPGRSLLDFPCPMDHDAMMRCLDLFLQRYDFLSVYSMGTSLFGKEIPMVRIGNEKAARSVLYVGSHHGMEWITTILLLRFINEYCEYYKGHRRVFNINPEYLFRSRLICIVPMLNPDGVDLQIHGADGVPFRDKLIEMNRGSTDFSHWQANGRGVDLNHNYNAGFAEYKELERASDILGGAPTRFSGEYPESEPEVGVLANYLRFDDSIKLILTLHTQGEEIYYSSGGVCPPKSKNIARLLSRMSGYALSEAQGMAAYGGLSDWAIRELHLPSFTVECGKGVNPLPLQSNFSIYTAIREMLFTAPILI